MDKIDIDRLRTENQRLTVELSAIQKDAEKMREALALISSHKLPRAVHGMWIETPADCARRVLRDIRPK